MINSRIFLIFSIIAFLVLNSCNWSKMAKGGLIGAGAGGIVGGIIGAKAGNTAVGAIVGAAVGGAAGAAIGRYMDKQAAEIRRDLNGATVERVGEGIKITFDSGILFNIDSDQLKPAAKENIKNLAKVLNKYKDTNILIEGHTDNTGSDDHNQMLSQKRASSVSHYVQTMSVASDRITETGYGETQPVADNNTQQGKSLNRRVEIAIWANEKLKHAAKKGDI